jgi:hypothetical protein
LEDSYFTREEINELMSEINDILAEKNRLNGCTMVGIYFEKGNILEMDIADDYGYEKTLKEKINLRKAPTFRKLMENYKESLADKIATVYREDNELELEYD